MDLTDSESTIGESVESAQYLNYSEIQMEESPRIEVPNGQILKNQYNNPPGYKYQPNITLANTIIYLLGKDLVVFKPYYFQKMLPIISQNTLG